MEMVILMKQVNIFKDFTNILINNLFSGSSLNTSSNSCTPRQVYRDLVLACVGDTMGKVVVHRPGGGRGVKHCDQVGQMVWLGSQTHTPPWCSPSCGPAWPGCRQSGPCHGKTLG